MRSTRSLAKKSLTIDEKQVRALKLILGATTESEAVRIAVHDRLALEEAEAAFRRIRARKGIEDVFRRSAPELGKRAS